MVDGELHTMLQGELEHIHSGKVRESFRINNTRDNRTVRGVFATDRWSAFDFVFGFPIPGKGSILTAENIFSRQILTKCLGTKVTHDVIAYGPAIDAWLPTRLRNNLFLQQRFVIVEEMPAPDIEAVVRGYLVGSGWKEYVRTSMVCGHRLPPGLLLGDRLSRPLFTPTTKESVGHDMPLSVHEVRIRYPALESQAVRCYQALAKHDESSGMLLFDTKFEFSNGVLCDEAGTSDSSRRVRASDYARTSPGTLPESFDKQPGRVWAESQGVHELSPENPEHRERVAALKAPELLVSLLQERYRTSFFMRTGYTTHQCDTYLLRNTASVA